MKAAFAILLLTAVLSLAQEPTPSNLLTLPPDAVVATIDGQKVHAAELQTVLRALSPQLQQANLKNPQMFLEQYGFMQRLNALAEKAGLEQKSPLKEQLAYNRMLAMAQAQLAATQTSITIPLEEVEKYYAANKDEFTQVKLKAIYIPFSSAPSTTGKKILTEDEAKAATEKLYAQIQAGADFVKLVKENSGDPTSAAKDGDFGSFSRTDQIPEDIKTAVFALKAGQVTQPLRQPNGYYLLRVEEISTQALDQVRQQIDGKLSGTRMNEWVDGVKKSLEIKIENPAILPAAPAPAAAK